MEGNRLFKKAAQQGRSKRGGEAYFVLYVEPPSVVRTPLGERSVLARLGWAGEMSDCFNGLQEGR